MIYERRKRDPHVRWCEVYTPSFDIGAIHPIICWLYLVPVLDSIKYDFKGISSSVLQLFEINFLEIHSFLLHCLPLKF
jgi:hypothetical protein